MADYTGSDSTDSVNNKNIERCLRNHLIIVNQFEVLDRIGKGGCGTVLKVKSKTDCKFYALKLIPLSNSDEENKLMREVKVLASLNHENVIGYNTSWIIKTSQADDDLHELPIDKSEESSSSSNMASENSDTQIIFEPGDSIKNLNEPPSNLNQDYFCEKNDYSELKFLCIQMEYCEQNLKEFIDKGKHFSDPEEQTRIMLEILNGLDYIHSQGVMHRDLKPSNIFLDKFGQVKIVDFGFARSSNRETSLWQTAEDENYNSIEESSCPILYKRSNSLTNELGTYFYVSPEINKGLTNYDQRVDLYSLGIVIFELFYQFSTEMERLKVLESIRQEQILYPDDVNQRLSDQNAVIDRIKGLLQHDPNQRASIDEIKKKLTTPESEDMEENLEIGVEFERNSYPLYSEILQSIGCIRVKGKLRGLCFRVGTKYLLTTYSVIERISMWKNCSIIFLNHRVHRKSATFQLNDANPIKWATPENNLAILELSTAKPNLPPPYRISCMEEHDDTLALVQITELKPFKFEVRLLTDSEFTMMEGSLFYYGTILQPYNMGSPIIRISENGRNFVTGMVLANYYFHSQKTGTCIIDCQKIYESFSPMIPFDLRKEIFDDSDFYKCHEHLMIKIENMENEIKKLKEITDCMIINKKK